MAHVKKMLYEMCSRCHLDEVSLFDIPSCILTSVSEMYREICMGTFTKKSIMKKDRIYYVIMLLIVILLIRVLCVDKHQKSNQPLWELDARWYP